MPPPDNSLGPFKNDRLRLEAVKVDANRQIVLSIVDKSVSVFTLAVILFVAWLAPEKIPITLGASGLVKGLSTILKR